MGMVGDLLYPDNADLAAQINDQQQMLQKTNDLHNEIVTSYRVVAESVRTLDAYLMALLVLQYHVTFAAEDLQDLPETSTPKLSQSIAAKVEQLAIDALSIQMAFNGLKALGQRVANVIREGGSYAENIGEGPEAVAEDLAPELDEISLQTSLLRSSNVELLTNTDASPAELGEMAGELDGLGEAADAADLGEAGTDVGETAESVSAGAEAAAEAATTAAEAASEAAAEAAAAGVEVGAEAGAAAGGAAILGPAIILVVVVTEIIGIFTAKATHDELEAAVKQLASLQTKSDASIFNLKKAYKSLLKAAKLDISSYNRMLVRLFHLNKQDQAYNRSYAVAGLQSFIDTVDGIVVGADASLAGLQTAAMADLDAAVSGLRAEVTHDAPMTDVIGAIKRRIAQQGSQSVSDAFLQSLAELEEMPIDKINKYDVYRQWIGEFASVLAPFHQQVQAGGMSGTDASSSPTSPAFGKPDPDFQPHPKSFIVPTRTK